MIINKHKAKTVMWTNTPTHSDGSINGFHSRVITNPERLAVDVSNETTMEGKSCNRRVLKESGQCSTSYTSMELDILLICFTGNNWPDLSRRELTVPITRCFISEPCIWKQIPWVYCTHVYTYKQREGIIYSQYRCTVYSVGICKSTVCVTYCAFSPFLL